MAQRTNAQGADFVAMPTADGQAVTGACVLLGFTIVDAAKGKVGVNLHNGTSNAGVCVGAAHSTTDEALTVWCGPGGIACPGGIYADVKDGTPVGAIFYHAV